MKWQPEMKAKIQYDDGNLQVIIQHATNMGPTAKLLMPDKTPRQT